MKKAKKILTLVVCAVLLVCISVGATIAYLTSQDAVTNTFTVGKVAIELDEAQVNKDGTWVNDHDTRVKANEYHLMPNHTYYKDPTVTVLKDSEPCFVRVQVTVQDFVDLADAIGMAGNEYVFTEGTVEYPNLCEVVGGWDANTWVFKSVKQVANATKTVKKTVTEEDGTTKEVEETVEIPVAVYEFWYKEIVAKNEKNNTVLDDLFETITLPKEVDNDALAKLDDVKITVNAHAIQADSFEGKAEKAWAAFDAK